MPNVGQNPPSLPDSVLKTARAAGQGAAAAAGAVAAGAAAAGAAAMNAAEAVQQGINSEEAHSMENHHAESKLEKLRDQLGEITPGKKINIQSMFNDDSAETVERVLAIGMMHARAEADGQQIKTPGVEFHMAREVEGLKPRALDNLRDAIVERMSSPESSQMERDVLQRMYNVADKAADGASLPNKLPPNIRPGGPFPIHEGQHPMQPKPPKPFPPMGEPAFPPGFDSPIRPGGPFPIQEGMRPGKEPPHLNHRHHADGSISHKGVKLEDGE